MIVILISLALFHTTVQSAVAVDSPIDKQPNASNNTQSKSAAIDGKQPVLAKEGAIVTPAKPEQAEGNAKAEKVAAADNTNIRISANSDNEELPASVAIGFYIFVGLGFLAAAYITFRAFRWECTMFVLCMHCKWAIINISFVVRKFRIRSNRAARRYGTRGNHSRHELQPLPAAMESDSDGDDQQTVVFDRQP